MTTTKPSASRHGERKPDSLTTILVVDDALYVPNEGEDAGEDDDWPPDGEDSTQ